MTSAICARFYAAGLIVHLNSLTALSLSPVAYSNKEAAARH